MRDGGRLVPNPDHPGNINPIAEFTMKDRD